jgi:hypothetical protein
MINVLKVFSENKEEVFQTEVQFFLESISAECWLISYCFDKNTIVIKNNEEQVYETWRLQNNWELIKKEEIK